jgi:hypothetical protein
MIIRNEITTKWWIAYNEDKSVVHNGVTEVGSETSSGQPSYEIFDNEQDYLNRLIELNINLE